LGDGVKEGMKSFVLVSPDRIYSYSTYVERSHR